MRPPFALILMSLATFLATIHASVAMVMNPPSFTDGQSYINFLLFTLCIVFSVGWLALQRWAWIGGVLVYGYWTIHDTFALLSDLALSPGVASVVMPTLLLTGLIWINLVSPPIRHVFWPKA